MTRHERIHILLHNYIDVINGLRDPKGTGDHIPLMCRAWNKPRSGYPELERLRIQLKSQQPAIYYHLANRYFNYTTRRILTCANPTCTITYPAWATINFHTHGRKHHPLIPRIQRITPSVDDRLVTQAITWLDTHWHGEPFLPDELKADNGKVAT